ncbi:MAG: hypothetical protein GPOALKHO_000282 [Sodalis sp.]|nr:MAG: hypothetical protein GPOALKHO_000282 [Sodalis sp.]
MALNSELLRNNLPAFGFFAATPIGYLVLGTDYMAVAVLADAPDDGRSGSPLIDR